MEMVEGALIQKRTNGPGYVVSWKRRFPITAPRTEGCDHYDTLDEAMDALRLIFKYAD